MLNFIYIETIFNFQSFYPLQTPLYLTQTIQVKKTQTTQALIGIPESSTRFIFSVRDLATQNVFCTYMSLTRLY